MDTIVIKQNAFIVEPIGLLFFTFLCIGLGAVLVLYAQSQIGK